jgi:hypothetical protein
VIIDQVQRWGAKAASDEYPAQPGTFWHDTLNNTPRQAHLAVSMSSFGIKTGFFNYRHDLLLMFRSLNGIHSSTSIPPPGAGISWAALRSFEYSTQIHAFEQSPLAP